MRNHVLVIITMLLLLKRGYKEHEGEIALIVCDELDKFSCAFM